MSFKCEVCNQTAPNGTVCRVLPWLIKEVQTPEGVVGTQIVKEVRQCVTCYTKGVEVVTTTILLPVARFTMPVEPAKPDIARFDRE